MIMLVSQKKYSLSFTDSKTKFGSSLHCKGDNSYLNINRTQICEFKTFDYIPPHYFCLEQVSKYFTNDKINGSSPKGAAYGFHLTIVSLAQEIQLTSIGI